MQHQRPLRPRQVPLPQPNLQAKQLQVLHLVLWALGPLVAAVLVGLAPPDAVQEPTSGCEGTADAGCHTAVPPCLNSHPHVTVWIRKKGLAYRSNDLLARLVSPEGEPQSEALVALKVQQQQQQEASGESARADEGDSAQRESEDKSYQDDLGLMLQVQATKGAEQVLAHLPRLRGSVKFHYR